MNESNAESFSALSNNYSLPPVSTLTKSTSEVNQYGTEQYQQYPSDQWLRYPTQGLMGRSTVLTTDWYDY